MMVVKLFQCVIAIALVTVSAAGDEWTQEPTDFRGLTFGTNEAAVAKHLKTVKRKAFPCITVDKDRVCGERFEMGTVPVYVSYTLSDDSLRSVSGTFDVPDFVAVKDAFEAKFGKPHRRGGDDLRTEYEWSGKNVEIVLELSASGRRPEATFEFTYLPWKMAQRAKDAEAAKKAATTF